MKAQVEYRADPAEAQLSVGLTPHGTCVLVAGIALLAGAWWTASENSLWGFSVVAGSLAVAAAFAWLDVRGLELTAVLPRGLHARLDRRFDVRLTQRSRWPAVGIDVHLRIGESLSLELGRVPVIARGSPVVREATGRCEARGRYQHLDLAARAAPLGLAFACMRWTLPVDVSVYPAVETLRQPDLPAGSPYAQLGEHTILRPGQDTELIGLREYQDGDSPRLVCWPATARTGKLIVKELARPSQADLTLALDLAQPGREWPAAAHEDLVTIAASVALHARRRGLRTQLLVAGPEPVVVPCSSGERHLAAIQEVLAVARSGPGGSLLDLLTRTLESPGPSATVVLIGPRSTLDAATRAYLMSLRGLGVRVALVLVALELYREQAPGERPAVVPPVHVPVPGTDGQSGPLVIYVPGRPLSLAPLLQRLG